MVESVGKEFDIIKGFKVSNLQKQPNSFSSDTSEGSRLVFGIRISESASRRQRLNGQYKISAPSHMHAGVLDRIYAIWNCTAGELSMLSLRYLRCESSRVKAFWLPVLRTV